MEAVQLVYSEAVEDDFFPTVTVHKLSKDKLEAAIKEIEDNLLSWAKVALEGETDLDKIKPKASEHSTQYGHMVKMHGLYSAKLKELGENLAEQRDMEGDDYSNEVNNRSKDPLEHAFDMLVTSYEGPKNEEAINKYLAMNVTKVAEKCGCDPGRLYDEAHGYLLRGIKTEGKPDFLDLDKDGDTKEPMKKAAAEAEEAEEQNEMFGANDKYQKWIRYWFDDYDEGTVPNKHTWPQWYDRHKGEMSDDKINVQKLIDKIKNHDLTIGTSIRTIKKITGKK